MSWVTQPYEDDLAYWLDQVLEAIGQGEAAETALAQVPEALRPEIQALVQAAARLQAASPPSPRPEFRLRAGTRLTARIYMQQPWRVLAAIPWPRLAVPRAWAWALGVFLLGLLLLIPTAVQAAEAALPGQPLYTVKVWQEDVQWRLTPLASRPRLYLRFAQRRITEIRSLVRQGRTQALPTVLGRWQHQRRQLARTLKRLSKTQREAALRLILPQEARYQRELAQLLRTAPAAARPVLTQAWEVTRQWRMEIQRTLGQPDVAATEALHSPTPTVTASTTPGPTPPPTATGEPTVTPAAEPTATPASDGGGQRCRGQGRSSAYNPNCGGQPPGWDQGRGRGRGGGNGGQGNAGGGGNTGGKGKGKGR